MNHRIFFLVGALFCAWIANVAHTAEYTTLRYGQNATSAGSLSSLPLTVAAQTTNPVYPPYGEGHECKPVDECEVGTHRSLGEGG